ncbi:hypothetical protein ACFQPC_00690 [Herminiimonas glaciei]|uniref:LPS export ABC transporter periplasmic protein LptC n=1 Tax=Herminiimonas glaciei TaxID=523788 RepID=A0ABW2I676_9BURK
MWPSKVVKSVFVGVALFAALYFVAMQFLGPGIRDFSNPIINGYEYSDAGGYEKTIIYTGNERPRQIIIDSRVDEYRVDGNRLLVARRPVESHLAKDNALSSRLLPLCEYWLINVKTHQVQRTADSGGLRCN